MRAAVLAGALAVATMLGAGVIESKAAPLMAAGGLSNVEADTIIEPAHYRRHWRHHHPRRHYGWWRGHHRHYGWRPHRHAHRWYGRY